MLALGARERGQHEGIVFDILNLIQNLHFEDKEMRCPKNHIPYYISY